MVRVTNVFGDITTGRHGEAVYQRKYGRGMRRLYKELKPSDSPSQLEQQRKFKESIAWVQSLNYLEKQAIKDYCKTSRIGYREGEPIHWYNWAKSLGMKRPTFTIVNSVTGEYKVNHPAILKIEEVDEAGDNVFETDDLSDVIEGRYTSFYQQVPDKKVSLVRVTILPGMEFEYVNKVTFVYIITFPCD